SVAAYHLAFGQDGYLYIVGPSTSSHDTLWRVSPSGQAEPFFRGLGRPQGIAFDQQGGLLVAASYRGQRGVVRITPARVATVVVSGNNLVGLAFSPGPASDPPQPALILATTSALFHLPWSTPGVALPVSAPPARSFEPEPSQSQRPLPRGEKA
ncbi:MAG: hypothetical protein ACRD1E_04445, partial [Terriglobales bacterium]